MNKFSVYRKYRCGVLCCALLVVIFLTAIFLNNQTYTNAASSSISGSSPLTITKNATVTVSAACGFQSSNNTYTKSMSNGQYNSNIGTSTVNVTCNDTGGYAVYATGLNGQTSLTSSSSQSIPTGTATGDVSNWSMKVAISAAGYNPQNMSITNSFNNYHVVPSTYTKIVNYSSATDVSMGSVFTVTYAVRISSSQPAGTYTGKVKYTLVHPSSASAPTS